MFILYCRFTFVIPSMKGLHSKDKCILFTGKIGKAILHEIPGFEVEMCFLYSFLPDCPCREEASTGRGG